MFCDYVGEAFSDKIRGKLTMIEDCWIMPTNNYPQSNLSATTDDTPTKNGVAAYTGNFADSVALILGFDALRKNAPEPITGIYYWDDNKREWVIGAAGFKTIEIYRPEYAAEIRVSA